MLVCMWYSVCDVWITLCYVCRMVCEYVVCGVCYVGWWGAWGGACCVHCGVLCMVCGISCVCIVVSCVMRGVWWAGCVVWCGLRSMRDVYDICGVSYGVEWILCDSVMWYVLYGV